MSRPTPPGWARALLGRSLPEGSFGRSVLRDLDTEFAEMAVRRGAGAARRWYAWEAVKLAAHFLIRNDDDGGTMERWARDVRMGLRRLRRAPGFAAVAVATMALGVGATVAIFSVVDAVLLEPLPYHEADRLITVYEWNTVRDNRTNVANPGNFRGWRDGTSTLASMSAVSMVNPATVRDADDVQESRVQYTHPDFFEVLGMEAVRGRTFTPNPSGSDVREVVLAHRYWRERFGSDPSVVGRPLEINGTQTVVVGVLPPEYVVFGEGTELWVSLDLTLGDQTNSGRWIWTVGRLADGASFAAAEAELHAVMAGLREQFPDFNAGWQANPVPLKAAVVGDASRALWILLGAVGLLLLIACANVANLFLVRATDRQREMAVRTSLGASGRSLGRLLLVESLLVAGLGAALGVGLAYLGTATLAGRMPDAFALPRVEGAGVDPTVLLFALVVTVATGVAFGLVPALQAARTAPAATLNAEARGPSRRTGWLRNALVVGEVALSVLLLAGAALFGRSLTELLSVDPGIDPEAVVVGRVTLNGSAFPSNAERIRFFDALLANLDDRPEVAAVGAVTFLPMDGLGAGTSFWPGDRPAPPAEERDAADIRNVAGDYFGTMGIALLDGRLFDRRDGPDAPQVAVVNRTLAETYWPGERAVGKPLVINWVDEEPWEIVGVVEDVRMQGLDTPARGVIYLHYPAAPFFNWLQVAVRGAVPGAPLAAVLRDEVAALDGGVPVGSVRAMEAVVARSAARPRMTAVLMGAFAALATLLAVVGLYGVLSYAVSRRVREVGVRIALGARPVDVLARVVAQGAALVVLGLVLGLGGALLGGRLVASLLFEIEPYDPMALGGAAAVLLVAGVAACLVPGWRAARIPAAEALRGD